MPSIRSIYLQAHASAYVNLATANDETVQSAVENQRWREESLKSETVTQTIDKVAQEVRQASGCPVSGRTLKRGIEDDISHEQLSQVRNLIVQGDLLQLLHEEKLDISWKSFAYEMPRNLLKFALNASIDCLPTKANLKRWNKTTSNKCRLCANVETTTHIISSCQVALKQGRFPFRHDSVLSCLVHDLDKNRFQVYADLDGFRTASGGTVPPNVLVTAERPDLVIIDHEAKDIAIFELTIPHENRIETSQTIKTKKYEAMVNSISTRWSWSFDTLEIGCRGLITEKNNDVLFFRFINSQPNHREGNYG